MLLLYNPPLVLKFLLFAASLWLVFRIPAFLFGAYAITLYQDEHYWSTYAIVSLIFISASLLSGQILPAWLLRIHLAVVVHRRKS
ncbi:MAG: hypothetical protein V3U36_05295 [Anaerolineales bacterium]